MAGVEGAITEGAVTADGENGSSVENEAEMTESEKPVAADVGADDVLADTGTSSSNAASGESVSDVPGNLELLSGVELPVTLCFGRRRLRLREVLDLNAGSVVELDRLVEEPVELLLHGRVIARGEVVVVDGNYGLRVLDVVRASGGTNA